VLRPGAHVQRIIDRDPADLWAHVTPDSSRRLLLAALDTFSDLGFEGATTRDISTRAEMSPAAVYVHYRVKLDLLQALLEVAQRAVWEAVSEAVDEAELPSERLRRFAEALAAWNACNYKLARVGEYELRSLPAERMETVRALRRKMETLVRTELRRGVEQEGFDVPDLRGTTLAVIALGADVERWYSPKRSIAVPRLAALHGELVLRMVRPWGATPRG
jgi:AcrR family transcriptional regulator